MKTIEVKENDTFQVLRWAAQKYYTTYFYFRTVRVQKTLDGRKLILKPVSGSNSWGRRGRGTLPTRLPDFEQVTLKIGSQFKIESILK